MKHLFLALVVLISSSCAAQTPQPTAADVTQYHGSTVETCHNKLDNSTLVYLKQNKTDEKSTIFADVTISKVVDTSGVHHVISTNEWPNYVCSEQVIP
jgi:hypothetical protein